MPGATFPLYIADMVLSHINNLTFTLSFFNSEDVWKNKKSYEQYICKVYIFLNGM
jgi:hypothetical protein